MFQNDFANLSFFMILYDCGHSMRLYEMLFLNLQNVFDNGSSKLFIYNFIPSYLQL